MEKFEEELTQKQETIEVPSFNSVTDHYQSIIGVPKQSADLATMPKPIRWFAYFFFAVFAIGTIAFIIGMIFFNSPRSG